MGTLLRLIGRLVRHNLLLTVTLLTISAAFALMATKHTLLSNWLLAGVSVVTVIILATRMWQIVRSGWFAVNGLAVIAIATAVILQQVWVAITLVALLTAIDLVERTARSYAQRELRGLLKGLPTSAHVLRKGKTIDVSAGTIAAHDMIVVLPGEIIPVDAVITEGSAVLDESILGGRKEGVAKTVGDTITSGSYITTGSVTAQALCTARESQYQQTLRLVQAAADHPAPFVRLADRYTLPFSLMALTIGGVAWILSREPVRFLDVLVVATPSALILATPITLLAGMARATQDGIIAKTGTAWEHLAHVKVFVFNKSGIVTQGKPVIDQVVAFSPFKKQEVLAYAAALEQYVTHPLAAVVRSAAVAKQLKLAKTRHVQEIAGQGLEAHVQGSAVLVGRLQLMLDRNIPLPRDFDPKTVKQTVMYVAINGKLAGYLTATDTVRKEAGSAFARLRALGSKQLLLVTGDSKPATQAISTTIGATNLLADALPGDKVRMIDKLPERPVAFVGNGLTDTAALMAADVGVAFGAYGTAPAGEAADVIVMQDNLEHVVQAVALAKRSFRIATESIIVGIGLSFVLMALFATGKFPALAGVAAQAILTALVVLNALRARIPGRVLPK